MLHADSCSATHAAGEGSSTNHKLTQYPSFALAAKTISGMLTIVFNESLATGEVPQDFKLGNIIPLLKPGKKDTISPANYRGITLNRILSKH